MIRTVLFAGLSLLLVAVQADADADADSEAELEAADYGALQAFVEEMVLEHGFERAELEALLAQARTQEEIIDRISRPAERALTWAEYRRIFLGDARIEEGARFVLDHREALARAHALFGVEPIYVSAILGVETRYGRFKGDWLVLDALYTLGFDYPPRADFFRRELEAFLLLAREEGKDPRALTGSYAGAMGWGQFISSSYRAYAVDFDDDGVRDIWANPVDAIGSVANYFAEHRWQAGEEVLRNVEIDDPEAVAEFMNVGLELGTTVGALMALGVRGLEGLAPQTPAGLWQVEAEAGQRFVVTFGNFYTITRYNRSHLYAMAVEDLARAIEAKLAGG